MLRRQLAAELRRLRGERTVAEIARAFGWSESKLSRIETAAANVKPADLQRLLKHYAVSGAEAATLLDLAGRARQRAWWEGYGKALTSAYETYIAFEGDAVQLSVFEAQVVAGLLQTAEYADALIRADGDYTDPDTLNQRVAVRMARRTVLTKEPSATLHVILDESALRRPIGGPDVLRRQLDTLVNESQRPNVIIQVLPFEIGAHRALAGSFTILDFAAGVEHPFVYCDGKTGGVIRENADDVQAYRASFADIREVALDPDRSRRMIADLAGR